MRHWCSSGLKTERFPALVGLHRQGDKHMYKSETEIEVRYAETDQMGVVYHANYLIWFEIGRSKLVEQLGFRYMDIEEQGYISPVVDVTVSYKKPVHYGERVTITTWIESYNSIRTVYGYHIFNQHGELCVDGLSSHVVVNKKDFRPISLRKVFPDWHAAYESAKSRPAVAEE
jgi:acyl-CoA thioester hydrolase